MITTVQTKNQENLLQNPTGQTTSGAIPVTRLATQLLTVLQNTNVLQPDLLFSHPRQTPSKPSSSTTATTKLSPFLKSSPPSSTTEPHLAGTATVHFAHAATVAYHKTTGAILYNFLHRFKTSGCNLIFKNLLFFIAMLHTVIFFTLCQIHPHAKRDYYKHQRECVSKAMLHDLVKSYYHFIHLLTKFSFTLLASFANHYIKDSKLNKHTQQHNKIKKTKQIKTKQNKTKKL